MGAVLSLPFFRRRSRRRRSPVSTPISHPRPLLRRDDPDLDKTEGLELLAIPKTRHSASTAGSTAGSRIVRNGSVGSRTSRRTRRRPGEFGQDVIPEVLEPKDTPPSVPSMSSASASDSSCSSKPSLPKPSIEITAPTPLPLPAPAPRRASVSISGVGSKRRLDDPRRQRRTSSASNRRNSIIGTKPRRVSTRKRRIESGWDIIRHDEADGWAPAAGRAGGKRVRLAWPEA
ncbi:hypothetical protein CC85DRAFT_282081 [Cutaneotrichosporon oleaginosum]|uniref:Uncharacterized protein n=1 Tax=Cutaneotrichosporon oleaginosum TaxID=879819 RepID=A0A0J1BD22_9TREE|nr:uncharacterized protein CC85DRAFT_282081 [Cutaneotrichosporon oleaginosum]KLT45944.1 hypothetical protein CC85DRAFT_282081 [Cutaneotrichosporon oleaginosum]TXT06640.1 hypothetical protein COLE_05971 [Cutaneotrichosporon oleaginosum]